MGAGQSSVEDDDDASLCLYDRLLHYFANPQKVDGALKLKVLGISKNPNNMLIPPPPNTHFELDPERYAPLAIKLLELDKNLGKCRLKLVPSRMKEEVFWTNYLHHVFVLCTAAGHIKLPADFEALQYSRERQVAINAVVKACGVCQAVFNNLVNEDTITKNDLSPVTVADYSTQAVIINELLAAFPNDPVVGEEDAKALREPANRVLHDKVVSLTNSVFDEGDDLSADQVLSAIDHGSSAGGPSGRYWTLDPIDGTAGFIRGDQFAVCLALIEDGEVVVGVLGCPNLPSSHTQKDCPNGCLLVAVKGQGARIRSLDDVTEQVIGVTNVKKPNEATLTESVEAAHSNHTDAKAIADVLGVVNASVRMDSQCKYATVARGEADIYMRLPTRKGYEERIWDHASGSLIVKEAGGRVTDIYGAPLDFSCGRTLRKNKGVIATNKRLHGKALAAIQEVLRVEVYTVQVKREKVEVDAIKSALVSALKLDPAVITVELK